MSDSQEFDITDVIVTDREGLAIETPGAWNTSDPTIAIVSPLSGGGKNDVTIAAAGHNLGTCAVTFVVPLSAEGSISRVWNVTVHQGDAVIISAHTGAPREIPEPAAEKPEDAVETPPEV